MKLSGTAFTVGSIQVSWLALKIAAGVLFVMYIWFGLLREQEPQIRLRLAFNRAVRAGGKHFGNLMKFLAVEMCLTMIGLAPLLFLLAPGLRLLALLAVPLWLLIVNPARMNAAAGMQDALAGGSIFTYRLADTSRWKKQVICGIRRMLFLGLWLLPLVGTALYIRNYWLDIGKVDAITWINMMKEAGNDDFLTGVINTLKPMVVMLAASVVTVIIGIAFHSGARHAAALEQPGRISGHHGMLVFGWLISLVFLLPLIAAVVIVAGRCSSLLSAGSLDELMAGLRGMIRFIALVLGGGILLTLPLLPFRSLMIADMVRQAGDAAPSEKQ